MNRKPYWNGHRSYWVAVACLPFEKLVSWRPFSKKQRLTPEQMDQECPGSGSAWKGKYRRTRCSTSNGLERHLPGDYQTSLRYFADCPICGVERAITKGKRLFVKHTRSPDYHYSNKHIYNHALEMASRRKGYRAAQVREDRTKVVKVPGALPGPFTPWPVDPKTKREMHSICGKPLPRSLEELAEMKRSYEGYMTEAGVEPSENRYYCTCGGDPEISVA
jgi:hypothetical protein